MTSMLRYSLLALGVLLMVLAALGGVRPSSVPRPDDRLSPSFTWGEVAPVTGQAGLSGVYHRAAVVTEMSLADGRKVRANFHRVRQRYRYGRRQS
jgi:hypothetical protein